jgi:hypothetical protein
MIDQEIIVKIVVLFVAKIVSMEDNNINVRTVELICVNTIDKKVNVEIAELVNVNMENGNIIAENVGLDFVSTTDQKINVRIAERDIVNMVD